MKLNQFALSLASAIIVAGGLTACAVEDPDPAPAPEQVVASSDEIVTGPMGPLFWPTGPITWAGGVGTWPIAVWSAAPLTWLALDIPGATTLSLSLATMDAALMTGFSPILINTTLLNTLTPGPWLGGLTPYYGMLPSMYGLGAYPYYGAPGYVYGLGYYPYLGAPGLGAGCVGGVGCLGTPLIDGLAFPGLFPAGLTAATTALAATPGLLPLTPITPITPFLAPTLTANALFFPTFPAFAATTPFLLNVTFSGLTAASMASLNVFAASTAAATSSLAIQATTFPILGVPVVL